jgi:hypothetical protein
MLGGLGRDRVGRAAALCVAFGALALAPVALAVSLGSSHQMEYFKKNTDVDGNDDWKKTTKCDKGEQATGGGALLTGNFIDTFATGGHPSKKGHRAWTVRGYNSSGGGKSMTIYAFCAKKLDLDYVKQKVTLGAGGATVTTMASCPENRDLAGGGVKVSGPPSEIVLNSSGPVDGVNDGNLTPDDAWEVRVHNTGLDAKLVTVYAICTKRSADLNYVPFAVADGLTAAPDIFQGGGNCGSALVSGGVAISGTASEAHLVGQGITEGDQVGDNFFARAHNDSGGPKDVMVTRICQPD